MGKFVKALTVAAMLAVAMLATSSGVSADDGTATALPEPLGITRGSAPAPGGGFGLLGITWE